MNKNEKLVVQIIFIIVISNFFCMFCFFLFNFIMSGKAEMVASIVSLVISFMIMPFLILKRKNNINLYELGIKKFGILDYVLLSITVLFLSLFIVMNGDIKAFWEVACLQLFVSISEEFLIRGIICYLLLQLLHKKVWVVIISALVFGFVFHTGGDVVTNLLYRFPAGIVLAALALYTRKLYPSIMLHFVYNVWCIYL